MRAHNNLIVLFVFFGWVLAMPVHAAWYQVELIVFDSLAPEYDGELWYENPGLPDWTDAVELIEKEADGPIDSVNSNAEENLVSGSALEKAKLIPFLQLENENLRLEGIQRVLKLSKEYRPLMHLAWQQPALTTARSRAVHLQMSEDSKSDNIQSMEPDSIEALRNQQILTDDIYRALDLIFEGTLRLRSSKFLHVDVDIAYFPDYFTVRKELQNPDEGKLREAQADYVRLQESRRIKLNEIHYFDHPMFGMILRVSRLKVN